MCIVCLYQYYQPLLAFGSDPRSYRLSDCCPARLEGGSAAYTDFHGNKRDVGLLRGEAFFDVYDDITLEAGEQASVSSDGWVRARPRLEPGELDQQLAWSHQKFDFVREPLSRAVNQLNRYNRRQLLIRDPAIGDVPFSDGFDSRDIDSLLKALQPLGIKAVPQQAQGASQPTSAWLDQLTVERCALQQQVSGALFVQP